MSDAVKTCRTCAKRRSRDGYCTEWYEVVDSNYLCGCHIDKNGEIPDDVKERKVIFSKNIETGETHGSVFPDPRKGREEVTTIDRDKVIRLIVDEDLSQSKAAARLGVSKSGLNHVLKEAVKDGEVVKLGYGQYRRAKMPVAEPPKAEPKEDVPTAQQLAKRIKQLEAEVKVRDAALNDLSDKLAIVLGRLDERDEQMAEYIKQSNDNYRRIQELDKSLDAGSHEIDKRLQRLSTLEEQVSGVQKDQASLATSHVRLGRLVQDNDTKYLNRLDKLSEDLAAVRSGSATSDTESRLLTLLEHVLVEKVDKSVLRRTDAA